MREGKKITRSSSSIRASDRQAVASLQKVRPVAPASTGTPPRLTRAVLYYRVSTDKQDEKNQVPELRRYAAFRKWTIINEYIDHGVSGGKDSRKDLDAMMAEIRQGRYDILLVYSYDRFARSLVHLVATMGELLNLEVAFASYQEQIDTTTAQGKLQFSIYAGLAEWQRHVTSQKTRAALNLLREEGVKLGRPSLPDEIRARIFELADQGLSTRQIAAQVQWVRASGEYGTRKVSNVSKSMVHKALKERPQNGTQNVASLIDEASVA